jgi:hypothetical protein
MLASSTVPMVLESIILLGSLVLVINSILALRAGRTGHRAVLLWSLSVLVLLAWPYVTGSFGLSAPLRRVMSHLHAMLSGALVMYAVCYTVPFLGRDCREVRAARRRASEQPPE